MCAPMTTFADLGVPEDLVGVLAADGIEHPFPIQELTIPDAIAGRDVCGKAKTGSGKTLAFGLPLIDRLEQGSPKRPRALVMVPTRELAIQVAEVLEPLAASRGHQTLTVYGGAGFDEQVKGFADGASLVVATPGRLIDLIQRGEAELNQISCVVLDEADRMADMGFLPQVEWVLRHIDTQHQTLLFSATLDGVIDGLVKRYQHDPVFMEVEEKAVTVEQMTHRFIQVHEMDKAKVAGAIAKASQRTLIFTNTKRAADRLTRDLEDIDVRVKAVHGDLPQKAREKGIADFAAGRLDALVASDVAARGLDIDEIDVVIHFDPPPEHKTYLHRSGRTARAGTKGLAVTLVLWNEELVVKRLQRRLGLDDLPIVEMFSNDERLADLVAWDPRDAI